MFVLLLKEKTAYERRISDCSSDVCSSYLVVAAFHACSRQGYVCNPSLHRNYTIAESAGRLGRIRAAAVLVEEGWGADTGRHDPVAAASALASIDRKRVV